jgi:hypothetical protein
MGIKAFVCCHHIHFARGLSARMVADEDDAPEQTL